MGKTSSSEGLIVLQDEETIKYKVFFPLATLDFLFEDPAVVRKEEL
jgi:hypothetical protein